MSAIATATNWMKRQIGIGEPADEIAAMVLDAIEEAQDLRGDYEARWDRNAQLYGGSHWLKAAPTGQIQYTFNRIQLAADAITAVITEQRPRSTFTPRENGAPGVYFVAQPAGASAAANVETLLTSGAIESPDLAAVLGTITPEQWAGQLPLAKKQGEFLKMLVQTPYGEALGLEEDDISDVDDEMLADALAVIYDAIWENSKWDWWFARSRDGAGIYGHQDSIYQFDERTGKHTLMLVPAKNTWIDPNATDIEDAQHYHWAQVIAKEKAISMYPQLKDKILAAAGTDIDPVLGTGKLSDVYTTRSYQRDRVVLLTSWFRDHQFEDGHLGILQVVTIAGEVVEKHECAYRDIPAIRHFNMPIVFTPYGRGEPEILEGPQDIYNRLGSIIGNLPRYWQFPQTIMPMSVRKALGTSNLGSHPGKAIGVPDELIAQVGGLDKLIHFEYPPQPSAWLFSAFEYFGTMIDDMAGRVGVLQGQAPDGVSSGVAIDSLRREARGLIGLRAMWAEKALSRLGDLVRGTITDLMPIEQWTRYTDEYPQEALVAIRALAKDVEMDVQVELSSGNGSMREVEQRKAMIMRQQGDLSQETFFEKMDMADPQQERKNILREQAEVAQLQMQLQMAAQAQQPAQPSAGGGGPRQPNAQRGEQTQTSTNR